MDGKQSRWLARPLRDCALWQRSKKFEPDRQESDQVKSLPFIQRVPGEPVQPPAEDDLLLHRRIAGFQRQERRSRQSDKNLHYTIAGSAEKGDLVVKDYLLRVMPVLNLARHCTTVFLALVLAAEAQAPHAPPIPPAGPLASPRSPKQVGAPVQATRAAVPPDNPQTPEKIALGEKLFFDGRLSVDSTVACSTCHNPALAFTDGRTVSIGVKGLAGQRNSPTILNALYNVAQFWDGRAKTLEQQAALPIVNPSEMGQPSLDAAVARIAAVPEYQQEFRRVFGRPVNGTDLVRAIASYERAQISFDSPFDRFIAGDKNAISDSAKRGWELFNKKARCNKCHALNENKRDPTFFMDKDFHNIGVGIIRHNVVALACKAEREINSGKIIDVDRAAIQGETSVVGRFLVTKKTPDIASFKTPGLRNIVITAPYFHDGSQATLWDVMDHYNKGDGIKNPWLDQDMQPLALREPEIDDVVAFLATLTSAQYEKQGARELARQRALSRTNRPQRDTARAFGPKPVQPGASLDCAAMEPAVKPGTKTK
jgi:cytochrome c peroxidase